MHLFYLTDLSKGQGFTKRQSIYRGTSQNTKKLQAQIQIQKHTMALLYKTRHILQDESLVDYGTRQNL